MEYAATRQGMSTITSNQLKLEETRKESPLESSEGEWLALLTRSLRTSTHGTEREQISIALSHSVCGHFLQQP